MGAGSRRFTIWHAALLLPWVVAAAGFYRSFNDNSYLWHVKAGDAQIDIGSVLTSDPFSFTMAGAPWRTQSWLAELSYSVLDGQWGLEATPLITAVAASVLFLILGLIAFRSSQSVPSTVVFLVLSTLLLAAFLNPRPVIFSFPMFAALVFSVSDRRLRWVVPLLMWVWAAVHGSFVIGLAYLALRAFGSGMDRSRARHLIAAGVPTLLTAHGWGVVELLVGFMRNRSALDRITEWYHPDLLSLPFLPLLLALFGLIILAGRGQLDRADWWIVVPFVALALGAARAVPPAWIALAPILSRLRIPVSGESRLSPVIAGAFAFLLIIGPFLLPQDSLPREGLFPMEAAHHLVGDNVFHDDVAGAWLVYTQWPERRIYIDDRAELYGERIGLMADLRGGVGDWKSEFQEFGIREALLNSSTPLAMILRAEGWLTTYEDDDFVVLRRP